MKILKHTFLTPDYLYHAYMLVDAQNNPMAVMSPFRGLNESKNDPFGTTFIQSLQKGAGYKLFKEVIRDLPTGLATPPKWSVSDAAVHMCKRIGSEPDFELDYRDFTRQDGREKHGEDILDHIMTLNSPNTLPFGTMTHDDFKKFISISSEGMKALGHNGGSKWFATDCLAHGLKQLDKNQKRELETESEYSF